MSVGVGVGVGVEGKSTNYFTEQLIYSIFFRSHKKQLPPSPFKERGDRGVRSFLRQLVRPSFVYKRSTGQIMTYSCFGIIFDSTGAHFKTIINQNLLKR
jgi:hypothetical protein